MSAPVERGGEQGAALISVIGVLAVLTILVTALLAQGLGAQQNARTAQDRTGAVAAAQAGVQDFLYRLTQDSEYWQHADPDWNGGAGAADPDNPALQPGGAAMPDADDGRRFRYDVDATDALASGRIVLTVTGVSRDQRQSLRTELQRASFANYVYYTDRETFAPEWYPPGDARRTTCDAPHAERPAGCIDIIWRTGDVVNGPFHTNDAILVSGTPRWTDVATTAWEGDGTKRWVDTDGTGAPVFERGGEALFAGTVALPPSNGAIRREADADLGGRGCVFAGPTYVELDGDELRVTSRISDHPDPPGSTRCTAGTNRRIPIPESGVLYVRNLVAGEADGAVPHPYDTGDRGGEHFDARAGDVYVEGELEGRLTIAAERNVVLVGDVTHADGAGGDDAVGLIANNDVEIFHPVEWSGGSGRWENVRFRSGNAAWSDVRIDAALLAVTRSFRVQDHSYGTPLGDLVVFGAIAQRFRGPVGTFSGAGAVSGYAKDYRYDQRLRFAPPPHFLEPSQGGWVIVGQSRERA